MVEMIKWFIECDDSRNYETQISPETLYKLLINPKNLSVWIEQYEKLKQIS